VTDWYASEESTRKGMVVELQRIARRARVRPWPVVAVAVVLTGLLLLAYTMRTPAVEAEVVLALTQGEMVATHSDVPVDELRAYVAETLLLDKPIGEMIERLDLYPSRKTLGLKYAIGEVRDQLTIEIWKNTLIASGDARNAEHSARIGLTVTDADGDRAYKLAHELADIVIQTARAHQQHVSNGVAARVAAAHDDIERHLARLTHDRTAKLEKLAALGEHRDDEQSALLQIEISELTAEIAPLERRITLIAQSSESIADRVSEAGLDESVVVVEERPPIPSNHAGFAFALFATVAAFSSLIGAALVVGAFDGRVHDREDVERLDLPVLGHVPGFPGDHIGSLESRGAARGRVPSFLRWRSHR